VRIMSKVSCSLGRDELAPYGGAVQSCRLSKVLAVAGVLSVAACSGTSSPTESPLVSAHTGPSTTSGANGQTLRVEATDDLRFNPATLTAKSGLIHIVITVSGKLPQTLTSRALGFDSGPVMPGHPVTLEIAAPHPGKYTFYSAYHQKQGMTGTLIIK
jgi:plastocyanin